MIFENIYRDINSRLSQSNVSSEDIYHKDVVNVINDAIASLRLEYIGRGQGFEFAETESFFTSITDWEFPFVKNAFELSKPLLRSLPISQTVLTSSFVKSDKEVEDELQTFEKGELVVQGDTLYKVTADVTNQNIFGSTFSVSDVRYVAPTIRAFAGDIFVDNGRFYKCVTQHTFQEGDDITSLVNFEQVFLRKIGGAYVDAMHVPFSSLHQLTLGKSIQNAYPFTIKDDVVYTTNEYPFVISYIPEWEQIEDLSVDVKIPDTMIEPVKQRAMQSLLIKIGGGLPQQQEG